MEWKGRAILHLDMDAFYPAVEVQDNPSLRGKPVIVGGSRERGVVSSASYEARKYGIHSAQPMAIAVRRCPHGIVLPVRMSRYLEVSKLVFDVFHRFSPKVEAVSIDEAFLDVTGCERLLEGPVKIAKKIKAEVAGQVGITVSAGLADTKFIAKIASDLNKPDGLTIVPAGDVEAFLHPLPIEKLWGVGKATQRSLAKIGVRTIGDLSRVPRDRLEKRFGKHGTHLHRLAHGVDERDVVPGRERKSIGHESTFEKDLIEKESIHREILSLSMRVSRRLRSSGCEGKTLTLKVKYNDFVQVTRSATLPKTTDDGAEIFRHASRLLQKTEAGRRPVRLLGVSVSHLCESGSLVQPDLFARPSTAHPKAKELNLALDRIQDRFGEDAILPGTLMKKENH